MKTANNKIVHYGLVLAILVFSLIFTPFSEALASWNCFGSSGGARGGGISFGAPSGNYHQIKTYTPTPTVYSNNKAKKARNINQFRRF